MPLPQKDREVREGWRRRFVKTVVCKIIFLRIVGSTTCNIFFFTVSVLDYNRMQPSIFLRYLNSLHKLIGVIQYKYDMYLYSGPILAINEYGLHTNHAIIHNCILVVALYLLETKCIPLSLRCDLDFELH